MLRPAAESAGGERSNGFRECGSTLSTLNFSPRTRIVFVEIHEYMLSMEVEHFDLLTFHLRMNCNFVGKLNKRH